MGWLTHMVLGDLGRSIDINDTICQVNAQAGVQARQRGDITSQAMELAMLKARTERLHLALAALSRFLVTKGVVNEAELKAFLDGIDREDGEADGKMPFGDKPAERRLLTPDDQD